MVVCTRDHSAGGGPTGHARSCAAPHLKGKADLLTACLLRWGAQAQGAQAAAPAPDHVSNMPLAYSPCTLATSPPYSPCILPVHAGHQPTLALNPCFALSPAWESSTSRASPCMLATRKRRLLLLGMPKPGEGGSGWSGAAPTWAAPRRETQRRGEGTQVVGSTTHIPLGGVLSGCAEPRSLGALNPLNPIH